MQLSLTRIFAALRADIFGQPLLSTSLMGLLGGRLSLRRAESISPAAFFASLSARACAMDGVTGGSMRKCGNSHMHEH